MTITTVRQMMSSNCLFCLTNTPRYSNDNHTSTEKQQILTYEHFSKFVSTRVHSSMQFDFFLTKLNLKQTITRRFLISHILSFCMQNANKSCRVSNIWFDIFLWTWKNKMQDPTQTGTMIDMRRTTKGMIYWYWLLCVSPWILSIENTNTTHSITFARVYPSLKLFKLPEVVKCSQMQGHGWHLSAPSSSQHTGLYALSEFWWQQGGI